MRNSLLSLVMVVLLTGCDHITEPQGSLTILLKSVNVDGIEYCTEIYQNIFSLYDTLSIRFRIKNNTLISREFNFSNIQQLAFELINRNEQIVLYYPYIVSPALSSFIVQPGETKELVQWSLFKDHSGRYIEEGYYKLNVFLADRNSPKISLNILIN